MNDRQNEIADGGDPDTKRFMDKVFAPLPKTKIVEVTVLGKALSAEVKPGEVPTPLTDGFLGKMPERYFGAKGEKFPAYKDKSDEKVRRPEDLVQLYALLEALAETERDEIINHNNFVPPLDPKIRNNIREAERGTRFNTAGAEREKDELDAETEEIIKRVYGADGILDQTFKDTKRFLGLDEEGTKNEEYREAKEYYEKCITSGSVPKWRPASPMTEIMAQCLWAYRLGDLPDPKTNFPDRSFFPNQMGSVLTRIGDLDEWQDKRKDLVAQRPKDEERENRAKRLLEAGYNPQLQAFF